MFDRIKTFWTDETATTSTEYAVIFSLVVIGLIAGIAAMGDKVTVMFADADRKWDAVISTDEPQISSAEHRKQLRRW